MHDLQVYRLKLMPLRGSRLSIPSSVLLESPSTRIIELVLVAALSRNLSTAQEPDSAVVRAHRPESDGHHM